MRRPIAGHSHARRMRAQGHDPRRIAAELGRSLSAVRFVLGPMGRPPAGHKPKPKPKATRPAASASNDRLERRGETRRTHAPRAIRVTLDERALTAAAVAFAMGEIDKAELLRRITH
jgi:hypothetical protein